MDLQTLTHLFATSFNPDPNVRMTGELEIRKISNQDGLITALLQIIATDSVDVATRQACAVWIKNRVFRNYSNPAEAAQQISSPDRMALRSSLLRLIATSTSRPITAQLAKTLNTVAQTDYPERWETLMVDIKVLLNSGDIREVYAGCVAALEVTRAFRFRSTSNDQLPKVLDELFPTLVTIASNMLQQPPSASQEIPTLLHLILKTYRTSILVSLSAHQQKPESIVPWGRLLFGIVKLELPTDAVPEDEDERETSEWWLAKKWAYAVLGRLFNRYGNPSQLPSSNKKDYGPFATHFVTNFAPEILNTYLQQVERFVTGQVWLSPKAQYHIFTFFTECVKPKATWALLKPHYQALLEKFIFPQLVFNATKQALWEEDPLEYVRVTMDEYETFTTPTAAATSFLFSMVSNRAKTTFTPILTFLSNVFQSHPGPRERFGALNMLAALSPFIMRHPELPNMEQLVLQWVTPELGSNEPFIKAIACEVIGTLTKNGLVWSSEDIIQTNFRGVAACLEDSHLPVRVQGALSLQEMVIVLPTVRSAVAPQISTVVQNLLKLSEETDLDSLNSSLETIVSTFQEELTPVAAQLTQRLCETYMRLVAKTLQESEALANDMAEADLEKTTLTPDEDAVFVAFGVSKTIYTIIMAVANSPEILAQVEKIVLPTIIFTLEKRIVDLLDNVYELVDTLTFHMRAISPEMWPVFELTYKLFKADGVDFLEEMVPSLDNFISFGSDVIASRPDYIQSLVDIYSTSINNEHLGENDAVNGSKLAESLLLNLRGRADEALQPIIATALTILDKADVGKALRLSNLEVLINTVLYNPVAALHFMDTIKPGSARVFFDAWFGAINTPGKLRRVHDKKLTILALCALLELEPAQVPETLKSGWPGIVGGVLETSSELPEAIEAREELKAWAEEEDDDADADEPGLDMRGDDEDIWDEDNAYLEMLTREGERLRGVNNALKGSGEDGEDLVSESDSDDDLDEELTYLSPIDNVNPYVTFKRALTAFQMRNAESYQAGTTSLSVEQQTALMEIMKKAEEVENTPAA